MRDRVLVRHFLHRFLEHDLVSPDHDRRGVLSAAVGCLLGVSLFAAVLVAVPYQFANDMPAAVFSSRALDDQFCLTSLSMLVMALMALTQWDALTLEGRDMVVLGTLPISHGQIVRCKGLATGILACAVLLAWNLLPTLFHAAAVPLGLHLDWRDSLRLTAAHALASGTAGLFGFLAVVGMRESSRALLGGLRFDRVSAPLQGGLVCLLTTAVLLVPAQSPQVAARRLATESPTGTLLPPLWFVAMYATVAESVTDRLPRAEPAPHLRGQEQAAAASYRRLRPSFRSFTRVGWVALLLVTTVALVSGFWNARRWPAVASMSRGTGDMLVWRAWVWLVTQVFARANLERAGFFFATQATARRGPNRMVMAAALAVGLSLVLVIGRPPTGSDDAAYPSVTRLAVQPLVLAAVLLGYRRVARAPAEGNGNLTFRLAWSGQTPPFLAGVKKAGGIGLALPSLGALTIWHVITFGPRLAALHFAVGVAVIILALDGLFFRATRLPFVSAFTSSANPLVVGAVSGAGVLAVSLTIAWAERRSFEDPRLYIALVATLLAVGRVLPWMDRQPASVTVELALDEQASLPTQRLGLEGV